MRWIRRTTNTRRPAAKRWLRFLVVCLFFSAIHVALGAWVVAAMAGNRMAVQVCTPLGVQWVLEKAGDSGGEKGGDAALVKPCVWAGAHAALASAPSFGFKLAERERRLSGPPQMEEGQPSGRVQRVLLMSSMRGPPASWLRAI